MLFSPNIDWISNPVIVSFPGWVALGKLPHGMGGSLSPSDKKVILQSIINFKLKINMKVNSTFILFKLKENNIKYLLSC